MPGRAPRAGSPRREAGSITAEFAAAMPAIALMLGCCLAGVGIVGQHVRLTDAAADAARALARGDDEARVRGLVAALVDGASLNAVRRGEFVCAELSAPIDAPLRLTVDAASCALAGGR